MKPFPRVEAFGTTVFSEFSKLAQEAGAVNLGQGFPDFDGPLSVKASAIRAIENGPNQYAASRGSPRLRSAIATHARRFYGQQVDPNTMVVVTSGATEAIFDAVLALTSPGDEVVLFEPFYDSYLASVAYAGAVPRFVPLRPPADAEGTWTFLESDLRAAVNARTRVILLNTPHNPTGKVFTPTELALIGAAAREVGAIVVVDEVYEHLVFSPARHVRLGADARFADSVLTISSAGKSFSFTGWKVGWALGPPALVEAVARVHQYVTFATASPFQEAVAEALASPDDAYASFVRDYAARKAQLAGTLGAAGFRVLESEGTYFLNADYAGLKGDVSDVEFCRFLTREIGVAAIPLSPFLRPGTPQKLTLARFAFCKTESVLTEAGHRLAALRSR